MARYIDLSDQAKGKVQLRAARKVNHAAVLADIAARADAVRNSGAPANKIDRRLESLRIEYRSALRFQQFAQTGINAAHVGLSA